MAEQYGKVVAIREQVAEVKVLQSEACAHCQLCNTGETRMHLIEMANRADAKEGDIVLLESPARELMLAAFAAWLLPLGAVLVGIALGYFLGGVFWPQSQETIAAVAGLAMLPPGYLLVKRAGRFFGAGKMLAPEMVRVVGTHEPGIQRLVECNLKNDPK